MSKIWEKLLQAKDFYIELFDDTGIQVNVSEDFNDGKFWINKKWTSEVNYQEAHVSVVDARKTRGLLMMHVCIFPHTSNDGPIFGFDVIGGKNKITGIFCDYSPTANDDHEMLKYFKEKISSTEFNKPRNIPEWGRQIFSKSIIAAGNVKDEELDEVLNLIFDLSLYYIENIKIYNNNADPEIIHSAQKNYCYWQRQNPHTPRTMKALGISEKMVEKFVRDCLFTK